LKCLGPGRLKGAGLALDAGLRVQAWPVIRGFAVPLLDRMRDPATGYRARLISRVLDVGNRKLTTPGQWEAYDLEIRTLAALLAAEGAVRRLRTSAKWGIRLLRA
jgi:hypothetical protein